MAVDPDPIVVVQPLVPPADKVQAAVREVMNSGVLTNDGPRVRRLEALLSHRLAAPDLAVCASGTAAIQLACGVLAVSGKEVIVPRAAFPAVTQAVLRAGGIPVAVDIEPAYPTIDPAAVAAAVTPRTGLIVAVHTFGCPADVDALTSIAGAAGVPLLCDAAPCWAISYRDRPLLSYGDVATLSLHATKLMHSVEGGAVIGNTVRVAEVVRRLRSFGGDARGASPAGTNGRMSELHAAVGALVLEEVDAEIGRRLAVRKLYRDALRDLDWLEVCELRPGAWPHVAAMPVRLAPGVAFDADALCRDLLGYGVHARAYFAGRYLVRGVATAGPTPNAEAAARRIVCLPFWGGLGERQVSRVVAALHAAWRRRGAVRAG